MCGSGTASLPPYEAHPILSHSNPINGARIFDIFIQFQPNLILTWVNGTADDSPQRIPCPVIKPVMELVETLLSQEAGGTVVEVSGLKQSMSGHHTGCCLGHK